MRPDDGRRVVVPHLALFTNPVVVKTAEDKRRLQHDMGIGDGDDIAQAKRILLDVVRDAPGVLDAPASDTIVIGLLEGTVTLRLRWLVTPPRQPDVLTTQAFLPEHGMRLNQHQQNNFLQP